MDSGWTERSLDWCSVSSLSELGMVCLGIYGKVGWEALKLGGENTALKMNWVAELVHSRHGRETTSRYGRP
jgi:hypothetical protein